MLQIHYSQNANALANSHVASKSNELSNRSFINRSSFHIPFVLIVVDVPLMIIFSLFFSWPLALFLFFAGRFIGVAMGN